MVYWCGNLINAGPPTRQIFRPVLSWTLDCPACGKRIMDPSYPPPTWCGCQVSFVQDAPLDEVLDHVEDLLEAHVPAPAVRKAFEKSWSRNEAGYRYLAER